MTPTPTPTFPRTCGIADERWLPIIGHEGVYEVSNFGNVRSLCRTVPALYGSTRQLQEQLIKPCINRGGYATVVLSLGSRTSKKRRSIHQLVATAFLPNPLGLPFVNHMDFNKLNNHVDNLEWSSPRHNHEHTIRHGRANKLFTPVEQLDPETLQVIRRYESLAEAARTFGLNYTNISFACRSGRRSAGYRWRRSQS